MSARRDRQVLFCAELLRNERFDFSTCSRRGAIMLTRRLSKKRLALERLEVRAMLAGHLIAFVAGGDLDLLGDADGNAVQFWQVGASTWRVQGIATTVNGSFAIQTFTGVSNDINAALDAGNNYIRVFTGNVPGSLNISALG